MMPVERLPPASALAALSLGFVSAVFDNIPLTARWRSSRGYDWGFLAYAVGFLEFDGLVLVGSRPSGVALSNMFPEGKSVGNWLRHGWRKRLLTLLVSRFFTFTLGWNPHEAHKAAPQATSEAHAVEDGAGPVERTILSRTTQRHLGGGVV